MIALVEDCFSRGVPKYRRHSFLSARVCDTCGDALPFPSTTVVLNRRDKPLAVGEPAFRASAFEVRSLRVARVCI